jgi:hypothetical protein
MVTIFAHKSRLIEDLCANSSPFAVYILIFRDVYQLVSRSILGSYGN